MKIGVIGGTFDPIHLGHIAIAEAAFREYSLDRLWFMPAGDPYFKDGSHVTPASMRYEMTKQCVSAISDKYICSDFEINDKDNTYSAETFRKLKELYPEDDFYFIMGLDSLRSIHKWYKPELLLKNVTVLAAVRHDDKSTENEINELILELTERYKEASPDIRVIHTPVVDISSTMIRNRTAAGESIDAYVSKEVEAFIREHQLYKIKNP